jgi:hypothetical protein
VDLARAFGYIFDDPEWTGKLVITAIIALFSAIFAPLLIGLAGYALLLGYLVELVRNVRDDQPHPLPLWTDYGAKFSAGGNVLVAILVYNIPTLLVACCMGVTPGLIGGSDQDIAGTVSFSLACCLLPLLLVYNLVTWPMLALGIGRYAETGQMGAFFQFGDLFSALQRNINVTIQWVILTFVANLILGAVAFIIPCLGTIVTLALGVPVQGYLLGHFISQVEGKPKNKPKGKPLPAYR